MNVQWVARWTTKDGFVTGKICDTEEEAMVLQEQKTKDGSFYSLGVLKLCPTD